MRERTLNAKTPRCEGATLLQRRGVGDGIRNQHERLAAVRGHRIDPQQVTLKTGNAKLCKPSRFTALSKYLKVFCDFRVVVTAQFDEGSDGSPGATVVCSGGTPGYSNPGDEMLGFACKGGGLILDPSDEIRNRVCPDLPDGGGSLLLFGLRRSGVMHLEPLAQRAALITGLTVRGDCPNQPAHKQHGYKEDDSFPALRHGRDRMEVLHA